MPCPSLPLVSEWMITLSGWQLASGLTLANIVARKWTISPLMALVAVVGVWAAITAIKVIVHRALTTANVPSRLEPTGLYRSNGKRPDGISVVPSGAMGLRSTEFLRQRVRQATGEVKASMYLLQRLSVTIQRGNSASVLGTISLSDAFEDFP